MLEDPADNAEQTLEKLDRNATIQLCLKQLSRHIGR